MISKIIARFSLFTKQIQQIQQKSHCDLPQLYDQLQKFEEQLSNQHKKKLPKKLIDFNRKFSRLLKKSEDRLPYLPLQPTTTHSYFYQKTTQWWLGSKENEKDVEIQEIVALSRKMVKEDLHSFKNILVPNAEKFSKSFQTVKERFQRLQEVISRHLFEEYKTFSESTEGLMGQRERQYKGDFQFKVVSQLDKVEALCQTIYHCALFNRTPPKLLLATQQIVTRQWDKLSPLTLARLFLVLAIANRTPNFIAQNFFNIIPHLKDHPFSLIFYMMVSGIQDEVFLHSLRQQSLILHPRNQIQQLLMDTTKIILSSKDLTIQIQNYVELQKLSNEGENFLEDYLKRYGYQWEWKDSGLFNRNQCIVQGKRFVVFDDWLCADNFEPNGLGAIWQGWLGQQGQLRQINWPRIRQMQKRVERDNYMGSKMKGLVKPLKPKRRLFE